MILDSVIPGACGAVVYVVATMIALRIFRRAAPAAIVTTTAIVVYVVVITIAAVGSRLHFWALSAAYWLFVLSFLMVFGAIHKSISLRILLDLLERPQHRDSYQAILDRYVVHESYRDRTGILIAHGLATRGNSGLHLTRKGQRIAAGVSRLQRFFKIVESG